MNFAEKVYSVVRKIPKGRVSTYKDVANAINSKAYRAVGQVLRCNPYAPKVPCHRVVKSDGTIGGFFGKSSGKMTHRKIAMLKKEGIEFEGNKIKNFEKKKLTRP